MIPPPYHSIHVPDPQPDAEQLQWLAPQRRCTQVRVQRHTCECQPRIYELCQAGGLVFVRRTDRNQAGVEVAETEWLVTARAQELWQKIITGRSM
ncbi:hypothetical protein AAH991_38560 [Microbispora sp. ZYX-F-249]|uniref:Uncharacterized protein n=1 Tax=Microbispora maris TaxID=3144104 RepID=A0ABV0B0M2_9ACTN